MNSSMQASKEELFGPVVAFYPFKTEEDLLKLANDSEVGLASYVYTKDLSKAWRAAELLQTGMVGVNTGVISDPVAPFGGIKHSAFGREGGRLGIEEFQIIKVSTHKLLEFLSNFLQTVTIGGLGLPGKSSTI